MINLEKRFRDPERLAFPLHKSSQRQRIVLASIRRKSTSFDAVDTHTPKGHCFRNDLRTDFKIDDNTTFDHYDMTVDGTDGSY